MAKYEFIDYEYVEKDEEIRKLKSIIPINFPKWTDKWEFIVPIQYLYTVKIPKHEEVDFISHENGEEFLREVNNAINFSISMDFSIYLEYIDECTSLHLNSLWNKIFLILNLKNTTEFIILYQCDFKIVSKKFPIKLTNSNSICFNYKN